jgi:plastocyanin
MHRKDTMTSKKTLRLAAAGAAVAAAAVLPLTASAGRQASVLTGTVGPDTNFTMTLKDASGAKVTALKAGAYTIKISDTAAIHNFHLTGPGVNKDSGLAFKGNVTWNVTLAKGTYKFVCDPHATIMKGSFTVS